MEVLCDVDPARLGELLARDEFFWLDLHDPAPAAMVAAGSVLGLHPLALEDSREFRQRPKLDRYPDAVLLVYYTGVDMAPVEVHLHISGGWLLTVRRDAVPVLDAVREQLRGLATDPEDYIVYRVLDALTDAFYPVVDRLEDRIDALEGAVLHDPNQQQLGEIYRLKQDVQALQRRVVPQRDQFGAAGEAIMDLPGLSHGSRAYLRDIGDHLAQITGELYRQIDDLGALTSTYFNASATRVNRVAARLTVIATFFLIWTLVTSFFGQNFGWLTRHIDSFEAFLAYETLGLVVPTVAAAAYFWRRRKEWW